VTYSDTDLSRNIINIGRRRERAIYYRPDGQATQPLPADAYSKMYYTSKGFTLEPKGAKKNGLLCPICNEDMVSASNLQVHLATHMDTPTIDIPEVVKQEPKPRKKRKTKIKKEGKI